MYRFSPITMEEASTVLRWRYHDLTHILQPADESFDEDLYALLRPDYHYYAVHDATGVLVGFCCYGEDAQVAGGDYTAPALDVGMGLRPDLVGQGRAHGFLQAILAWGVELFDPELFRCTVAAVNPRSQRMFARAGFMTVQRFVASNVANLEFIVMVRVADTLSP
jgi:ribosomal-protein-alanine N-acetyltransferase